MRSTLTLSRLVCSAATIGLLAAHQAAAQQAPPAPPHVVVPTLTPRPEDVTTLDGIIQSAMKTLHVRLLGDDLLRSTGFPA